MQHPLDPPHCCLTWWRCFLWRRFLRLLPREADDGGAAQAEDADTGMIGGAILVGLTGGGEKEEYE